MPSKLPITRKAKSFTQKRNPIAPIGIFSITYEKNYSMIEADHGFLPHLMRAKKLWEEQAYLKSN
jgi:hypothetical protein